ncbi:MAG: glycerophosphodiester phosphodiesterase family protein [Cyanobacteria bacterium J06592_8]
MASITNQPAQMTGLNGYEVKPVVTIGETISGSQGEYIAPGILDGIGAFELDENTVRVLANHELTSGSGYAYTLENGTELTGARVSYFDLDKNTLEVVDAGLAYDTIIDRAGEIVDEASDLDFEGLNRFCSSHYIAANQFGEGFGFVDGIYFTGEETYGGTEFALDVATDTLHAVPWLGKAAWENVTQIDTGNSEDVAILVGDDREAAPLLLYIGEKDTNTDAGFLERNGLVDGSLYVWVPDGEVDDTEGEEDPDSNPDPAGFSGTGNSLSGEFVEIDYYRPDLAGMVEDTDGDGSIQDEFGYDELGFATQAQQDLLAEQAGAFQFSRPEDIATNPMDGTEAVLASTGREDRFPSDVWGTTYTVDTELGDLNNITSELTIIYDGDDAGNGQFPHPDFGLRSPDNLDWADDGHIYVQEDGSTDLFGLESGEEASIWKINPTTGELTRVAEMDRSALPGEPIPQTDSAPEEIGAWESSGILDVSELFNRDNGNFFLFDVQAHGLRDGVIAEEDLVQGGQLAFLMEIPEPSSESVPYTHAHNDYEHPFPLLDALSYGFISVESDIWLYPDDNENLRVAHDPVEDPTTLPTLEELYLDPLQDLKEEFDNGGVYADGTPLTLLIDIKSEGLSTYQRLHEVLGEYQEESPGLFTTYTQDETGNYTITPGAVTPIISGDRPREFMESQEVRYAGYDGRKDDIGTDIDPGFMPLISDNWNNFFSDELAWDGIGTIPEDTEAELNRIVSEVQGEDKIFRFWNLPQDAPSVWGPLLEAEIDLINTDNLAGLSTFIQSQLETEVEVEPVDGILEVWEDASIDYALVVAHRGGYYENGVTTLPENSLATIEQAIDEGVEMVELDVWKTEDGEYVIIHDQTVDRTTTGSGRVDEFTLEELKELNLIIEDTGEVTSEKIPTLEEALEAVDGEILFNVDIKLPVEELVNVMNIAREMGVDEQIVIKNPVNNDEQLEAVQNTLSQLPFPVQFMPIIDDNLVSDPEFIVKVFEEFQPDAAEMLVRPQGDSQELTEDGGFLFSEDVQAIASEYDVRLWINTLFANPEISDNGFINGFRTDVLALTEPDEVFGFWVDAGASILQTDEPLLAVDYLEEIGERSLELEGTDDNDLLIGLQSNDTIAGLQGNDEIVGLDGDDILRGDANSRSPGGSSGGNDTINGGAGDDQIGGKAGDDELLGGIGNDSIWGDDGDDLLRGGSGDDVLTGDDFSGGEGVDTFILAMGEGTDTITDFEIGVDLIGLAEGLTFDALSFTGSSILLNEETLAVLNGIDTTTLTEDDFTSV